MKGAILNKRYKLNEVIGTGGMAKVYDAFDMMLERNVAIKVLKSQFVDTDDFLSKFKTEATSAASLSDENIVAIYDVGSEILNDDKVEYIVMEKIEGTTLKDIIDESAPLSDEKIISYGKQIALALQAAHRKGVVHRDIKPANIMINEDDKVKVTDFGIARVSSDATIAYTSSILGTVHYISPEQVKGQAIDNRSDLYSLGVVLYEMATGDVPFDADTPVSIAIKHIQDEPLMVTEINSDIDPNIANIINKLLKKDAVDRYQTSAELIRDLDNYRDLSFANNDRTTQKFNGVKNVIKAEQVNYKTKATTSNVAVETKNKENRLRKIFNIVFIAAIAFLLAMLLYFYLKSVAQVKNTPEMVAVPNLIDYSEENAFSKLEELNLVPVIDERIHDTKIQKGYVTNQSVNPRVEVTEGTEVRLTISKGAEVVTVPRLTSFTLEVAKDLINQENLGEGGTTYENSDKTAGVVIGQFPEAYSSVNAGTPVDLVVSSGPKIETVEVPNLEGQELSVALETLRTRDLIPGSVTQDYSDKPENIIIYQSRAPGESVDKGTAVNLVVSRGVEDNIVVPSLKGLNESVALDTINKLGLVPRSVTSEFSDSDINTVISQSLTVNSEVEKGTEIDLVLSKGPEPEPVVPEPEPDPIEQKKFIFNIQAPEGSENFNVKVFKTNSDRILLHEEDYITSELNNGTAVIQITEDNDAVFEILINDKVADVNYE